MGGTVRCFTGCVSRCVAGCVAALSCADGCPGAVGGCVSPRSSHCRPQPSKACRGVSAAEGRPPRCWTHGRGAAPGPSLSPVRRSVPSVAATGAPSGPPGVSASRAGPVRWATGARGASVGGTVRCVTGCVTGCVSRCVTGCVSALTCADGCPGGTGWLRLTWTLAPRAARAGSSCWVRPVNNSGVRRPAPRNWGRCLHPDRWQCPCGGAGRWQPEEGGGSSGAGGCCHSRRVVSRPVGNATGILRGRRWRPLVDLEQRPRSGQRVTPRGEHRRHTERGAGQVAANGEDGQ
ncbi:hypothetical protein ABH941_007809 [Streptacidiphilus sp. EB103A]